MIFNPAAGRRRRRRFSATLAALRDLGCAIELRETTGPGAARVLAGEAAARAHDVVVAAGGDGTINETINGLIGSGTALAAPPLAIIPLGTANVLAAEIGLGTDPKEVARTITAGAARPVALGRANGRHFTAMAGVGFDAQVVAGVDLALKRRIGKAAYLWESLRQLARHEFPEHRVVLDGREHRAASVIVAKGRFYAGRFVVAPEARLDEALFQVCLFERPGAWNALRYAAALSDGRLARLPDTRLLPAREVVIEGAEGDPVQGDGDVIARLPVRIEVRPEALRLVMPPEGPARR